MNNPVFSTVQSTVMKVNSKPGTFLKLLAKLTPGIIAAILLLLPACSMLPADLVAQKTPEFGSEPGIPESQILFSDDFSAKNGGWSLTSTDSGSSVAFTHQGLEFIINEKDQDFWSTLAGEYSNIGVGVDAGKLGGPDDNTFGVICRYQDAENFYAFLISSDGYYGIIKIKDGKYSLLSGKNMDYDAGIVRGKGTNRILGICSQDELGLFVNGKLLTIVQDPDLIEGRVGMIAGTNAVPGTDILFDNLILYQQ
jgi:hypothetical protein